MSALSALLNTYRAAFASEREKGNYFEGLICAYLRLPAPTCATKPPTETSTTKYRYTATGPKNKAWRSRHRN